MLTHTSIIEFPSLKTTRRYGAKVRTGCTTCKLRHIRCDETKPYCSRCTSTGRTCGGYAHNKAVQGKPLNPDHSLVLPFPTPKLSASGDSVHYLEFYHHCAGATLSNNFDNGFWSRIVLQLSHSESSVRHALIALGYLAKTEPGSLKHARSGFAATSQSSTLLFHYNRAIKCLVERMSEPSYAPEIGLVSCLLFICIEFLRGHYQAAFTHLNNGLKIISERQGHHNDSQLSTPSGRITGSVAILEDDLVPIFLRTITPALLYGVNIKEVYEMSIPCPQTYQEHPFTTIEGAQSSYLTLRNPTIHFLTSMAHKIILRDPITSGDLHTEAQLLECHHAWLRALQTVERESHLSEEDKVLASSLKVGYYSTYIGLACATVIQQTAYDVHIASFKALVHHAKIALDAMNLPPASLHSSARGSSPSPLPTADALSKAKPHVHRHPAAHFTFEIALIPSLYFTATRCRCPTTRREAVSLLAMNPPREALWDAEQHATVSRRVIEIEESKVDPETGWPVEGARLWCAVIDGNMDRNGGFWVSFALADWVKEGAERREGERRRADAQWEEWFVL